MQQLLESWHLSVWELVRIVLIEMSAGLSTKCSQPIERDPVKRSWSRVSSNRPVKELKHTFIHWYLTAAPQSRPEAAITFCVCFVREYRKKISEILLEIGKCLNIRSPEWKQHQVIGFPFQLLTYWILKSSQVKKHMPCRRKNGHHLQKTPNLEVWTKVLSTKDRFPSAKI